MPPIKIFPAFTPLIQLVLGNLVNLLGEELERVVAKYDKVFYHAIEMNWETLKADLPKEQELKDFFSDGVHPSKLTYQLWAKDISDFLWKQNCIEGFNTLLN